MESCRKLHKETDSRERPAPGDVVTTAASDLCQRAGDPGSTPGIPNQKEEIMRKENTQPECGGKPLDLKLLMVPGAATELPAEVAVHELCDTLSDEDRMTLRQLIGDRIENRFEFAAKAAHELNLTRLEAATTEIKALDALREKL